MTKVLYNKCVYKCNETYVIPIAFLETSGNRKASIRVKVIKGWKENDICSISYNYGTNNLSPNCTEMEKLFNINYKPYIWDDGLFKDKTDNIIYIESIEHKSCIYFNKGIAINYSYKSWQDLISMNLVPA